jgi:hypothetical protein
MLTWLSSFVGVVIGLTLIAALLVVFIGFDPKATSPFGRSHKTNRKEVC